MEREAALTILRADEEELRHRFGVKVLALFGSVARGSATADSDVDILVDFDRPVSLFDFAGLRLYLEDALGVERADVTMRDSIFPPLKKNILGDAVYAFGEGMEISH